MPATQTQVRLPDQLRISTHGDGAVILDVQRGQVFSANAVGARVLELLKEGRGTEDIIAEIGRQYGEAPDRVRADVLRFLDSLRASSLLQA